MYLSDSNFQISVLERFCTLDRGDLSHHLDRDYHGHGHGGGGGGDVIVQ